MAKPKTAIERWQALGPHVRIDLIAELQDEAEGLRECEYPHDKPRERRYHRKARRLDIMAGALKELSLDDVRA